MVHTFTVTTNSLGGWSFTYIFSYVTTYNVMASWGGNSTHFDFINMSQLTVEQLKVNSTIIIPNNTRIGQNINITGIATDEFGNPLINTTLLITVDCTEYVVVTNSTGGWSIIYTTNTLGNLTVIVSLTDSINYMDFINSTTFTVGKIITNSTIVAPNGQPGQTTTISGIAKDENNNPIANTQITVTINGTSYTVTTNSAGAWSLNYTPSVSGSLNVIVTWVGNTTHNGFTNSTILNVGKLVTNSTIVAPNGTVGKPTTITGVAKDENGNLLANTKLTVTVNGKTYNVTTNNAGE